MSPRILRSTRRSTYREKSIRNRCRKKVCKIIAKWEKMTQHPLQINKNEVEQMMRTKRCKKEGHGVGGARAAGLEDDLMSRRFPSEIYQTGIYLRKQILRRLLQSNIAKVRPYSNTPVGRRSPGPERIPMRLAACTLPPPWFNSFRLLRWPCFGNCNCFEGNVCCYSFSPWPALCS